MKDGYKNESDERQLKILMNNNIERVKYRQKNESYERNILEICNDLNHEEYDMNLYYYLLNAKITDSLGKRDK